MDHTTLPYRGTIQGITSAGSHAAFITTHEEGQATALYRIDSSQQFTITESALPSGATALVGDGKTLWFAGQDDKLYQAPIIKGRPKALPKLRFEAWVIGLAILSNHRLAVLQPNQLTIVDCKKNKVLQEIAYSEKSCSLASSPDGLWLAVGDNKGTIFVYQSDEKSPEILALSAESSIHKGAVTTIQFEAEALRFYSTGTDKKLFSTHAQGELQPLDRGKNSNHKKNIHALHLGKTRFFTGAADKSIKAWPIAGGQPFSLTKGLVGISAITDIIYQDKACLLAVGRDASLRCLELTSDEKLNEVFISIKDGYVWGKQLLLSKQATEREEGVQFFTDYDDKKALTILATHYKSEKDKGVCEKTISLLIKSTHTESTLLLESLLYDNRHIGLREKIFSGLLKRATKGDLRPFEKALDTGFFDVGSQALEGLAKRAKKEPRAEQALVKALNHRQAELRLLALSLLEKVYARSSPRASLLALKIHYSDLQRAALIRLYQRKLLEDIDVKRAILLSQSDKDEHLRHTALFISILSRKELTKALKTREERFARQLQEIEDFELLVKPDTKKSINKPKVVKPSPLTKLKEEDYAVLLQSMTSHHYNVCFHAAYGLAVLQDQRAFGVLLSLSQRNDGHALRDICNALSLLGDRDAIPVLELLLNHKKSEVREAAYTGLDQLQSLDLVTAKQGFQSKYEDIHARALKILLDKLTLKTQLKKADYAEAIRLLKAALNNPFPALRQETFKACLNRKLGGSEVETLTLLLESTFENIHKEVLNELMTKSKVLPAIDWIEPALFGLFNNPFKGIRIDAFNFGLKEKKRFKNNGVLIAATASQFSDVRLAVLNHIRQKPSKVKQQHLQILLDDKEESLRSEAIKMVLLSGNKEVIIGAMDSPYDDVQVKAAMVLASFGDKRSYAVFDRLLSREKPKKSADRTHWQMMQVLSLIGLGTLADDVGFDQVINSLKKEDDKLVASAAKALPWVTNTSHSEALYTLQKDERETVRVNASFSLAMLGDKAAIQPLANESAINSYLSLHDQLAVHFCLDQVTPIKLEAKLRIGSSIEISAILGLVAYELLLHGDEPKLTTLALGINDASLQLFCAGLISCYSNETARWEYVQTWLIKQQNNEKWTISIEQLKEIATVLVYGDGHTKVRLFSVLQCLDSKAPIAQWEITYQLFRDRYVDEIKTAVAQLSPTMKAKPLQSLWNQRAFGTYLAQVNQVGESGNAYDVNALIALRRLYRLAEQDSNIHSAVLSCLLTLLNHHHITIRQFAFDHLQTLGMDLGELGKVATTSPQQDIAKQGLQLLTTYYSLKKAQKLLQSLIQSDDPILSVEAYDLYCEDKGLLDAAQYALQSYHIDLRRRCIYELASDKDKKAQAILVQAVTNDEALIGISAARHLARQAHPKALSLLVSLLKHNKSERQQKQIIRGLQDIDDSKVAVVIFDYLTTNPFNRVTHSVLYNAISNYRPIELFDRLLARATSHPKEMPLISQVLLAVTGYDQYIEDYHEEKDDLRWLDKQHPRHDDLLVRLFSAMINLNQHKIASTLLTGMGWSQTKTTDAALKVALFVIEPVYLPSLIETLKYRLKRRQSSLDALLELLTHKDNEVQFLAAEGLALNGHNQGFAILLAGIDYQENDEHRERAVLAIGRSGDQRALDKLLQLAENKEHQLNEAAIEAIGSMGESEQGEKVFKLLQSSLKNADYYSDMNERAISGLRWFNTEAAWQIIISYIADDENMYSNREHATKLLQHWDSDATRSLLLKLLSQEEDDDVCRVAYFVAQRLWQTPKDKTSAVDYAMLQGYYPLRFDNNLLERVSNHAPTADLLDLLVANYAEEDDEAEILGAIDQSLLKRTDYKASDLGKALSSHSPRVINTVSRLITRMDKVTTTVQGHLQNALAHYYQRWQTDYELGSLHVSAHELKKTQGAVLQLLWATVKQGVVSDRVTELLASDKKEHVVFIQQILNALLSLESLPQASSLASIEPLLKSPIPTLSRLANQLMQLHGQGKGIDWQHFQGHSIMLDQQFNQSLVDAVTQPSQQSLALPALIAKKDVATLLQVANDEQQQEIVRIGAIEGMSRILTTAASDALSDINKNTSDKDISKAAYRALRRQQRSQQKADQLSTQAGA